MAITLDGTTGITTPAETNSGNLYVTGNVGIGTVSPGAKFQVESSADTTFRQVKTGQSDWAQQTLDSGVWRLYSYTAGAERMRIDSSGNFQFNSGYGSVATAYGCRAWVNFNGTGTVAIRGSGNVSSITDTGTGNYTVNFTTAMPDINYSVCGSSGLTDSSYVFAIRQSNQQTVNAVYVVAVQPSVSVRDDAQISVAIFR